MSWLRVEGKMPQHAKVAPLSDAAFRLHVTAMAWSAEFHTDGRVPKNVASGLTRAPSGKRLQSTIDELEKANLWHVLDDCYEIHDFLQWNMSAADYQKRAESGSAGGKAKASKRLAPASESLEQNASKTLANSKQSPSKSLAVSVSESEERNNPPPKPEGSNGKPRPKDPMGDSLTGNGHWQRADVARVFDVWKSTVGMTEARREHWSNPNTESIADAIDANGIDACMLVAKHCMRDRMVNGEADEHKNPHKTTRYIFGNQETFQRILTEARKLAPETPKKSVREQMRELGQR